MNHSPLSFSTIAAVSIKSWLYGLISPSVDRIRFPKFLGNYQFVRTLDLSRTPSSETGVAVYRDQRTGKLIALKRWAGRTPDGVWLYFTNELLLNRMVSMASLWKRPSGGGDHRVSVPRLIRFRTSNRSVSLWTEYAKGTPASRLSANEQVRLFLAATTYLETIGERIKKQKQSLLTTRTNRQLVMLYPFLLVAAMVRTPEAIPDLVRGAMRFASCVPSLLRRKTVSLIHRDLNPDNLLSTRRGVALLDLQLCVFADPFLEYSSALRFYWDDIDARQRMLAAIRHLFGRNPEFPRVRAAFCVLSSTHALTCRHFPVEMKRKFLNYLQGAIRL